MEGIMVKKLNLVWNGFQ